MSEYMSEYDNMVAPAEHEDRELSNLRVPPHSVEAEQSVLGGLLLDNAAWDTISDIVSADDFYRHEHKVLFRAVAGLLSHSKPADIITVQEALERSEELEAAGGFDYLINLVEHTPSAANIKRYAEIVKERSILRQLAEIGTAIARNAYNPQGRDAKQILDEAENSIFQIAESSNGGDQGFLKMEDMLLEIVNRIDYLSSRSDPHAVTGVSTGFIDLDKKTSGLQPGDLIIVAGRPSMGKTAFAINIAEHVAVEEKLPVAIFSMEMGGAQLVSRMISSIGQIDAHVLKTGQLEDQHWDSLAKTVNKLSDAPIYIDETANTALEIRARSRRLARQFGGKLGLIVIDYIQMMSGSRGGDNRVAELAEISRSLKLLAKELHVPIIVLSQLSRNVENRTDKHPMMSDLRDSGAIEQDADLIMLMYRDEYYHPDSQYKGLAECMISKHRNGSTGTVWLSFMGMFTKFGNSAYIPDSMED